MISLKESLSSFRTAIYKAALWLGPRGSAILLCAVIWIQVGVGTIQGYSGKPSDAPHLLLSGDIRGVLWITFAVIAVFLACSAAHPRHAGRRKPLYRYALVSLAVMPVVRLISYGLSWVLSLDVVGDILNDSPGFQGSQAAAYGTTSWQVQCLLIVVIGWFPASWEALNRYLSEEEWDDEDREEKRLEKGE